MHAFATKGFAISKLIFAILFLSLSLFFRYYDDNPYQFMYMGVHWLWHVFSAIGAFFIGKYLITTEDVQKIK